jgi:hypothetical protein
MLVVKCDLCKVAIEDDMHVIEVKVGKAGAGGATDALAAHVCNTCWKALGAAEFLHKFRSMGATDLMKAQVEQAAREARPQIAGPDAPVPVDPRLMKRIQGR